jgi:glycosyltransferase involved in cell wall biosynthesis
MVSPAVRVVQIVNYGFEYGGAEKSVRLLAEGLAARGHEVRVIAVDLPGDGQPVFADHLVPAIRGGPIGSALSYLWHQPAYREVRRILREFQPDLVHFHTIGEFSPSVLAAARGYPRLLTARVSEHWMLKTLRWNLPNATGAGRLSALDTVRYLRLRYIQRPGYRVWLRGLDRALALSAFMADTIRGDLRGVPVYVVPNGSESGFDVEPLRDAGRVVFIGRLEQVKGAHVLLEAFRRISADRPGARLTIIGDGSQRARLESAAADLVAAGRVEFRGRLGQPEIARCLRSCAVVAVPSLWPEVFGRVALEALQTGRAVVASRVGGLPELVDEGNGRLVEPGDVAGLARALAELLGDRPLLERLGAESARRAKAFGMDAVLDAHEAHYAAVLAGSQ